MRLEAVIFWHAGGMISQHKGADVPGLSRRAFLEALSRVEAIQITGEKLQEELMRDLQARAAPLTPPRRHRIMPPGRE